MKKCFATICGLAFASLASASGDPLDSMVGTWKWEQFTVEVAKCEATGVCAKVVSGPKNVGMEMIKSRPEMKDGAFVGKVAHPMTGETYNSKMTMPNKDTWHMDGCTDAGACASGDFVRVK